MKFSNFDSKIYFNEKCLNVKKAKTYFPTLKNFANVGKYFSSLNSGSGCLFIKPKMYADVNVNKEKEYHDFENMKLKFG